MQPSNEFSGKTWSIEIGIHHRVLLINDENGNAVGEFVDCRRRSDALLIAAAPALLVACRAALHALTTSENDSKFMADMLEFSLSAAIRLAEGVTLE
jgi:hypothetical protein